MALYLFKEGKGTVVHNQVEPSTDLLIPQRYFVLHSAFLVPPWKEFYPGWSYWKNIGINIAGFIPLGLFLCLYFTHILRMKQAVAASVVVGFLVSLTIEVSQAFLPTRDSGMTDIITNTLGTFLGAMLCSASVVQTLLANFGLSALGPNARVRINSDLAMVRTRLNASNTSKRTTKVNPTAT